VSLAKKLGYTGTFGKMIVKDVALLNQKGPTLLHQQPTHESELPNTNEDRTEAEFFSKHIVLKPLKRSNLQIGTENEPKVPLSVGAATRSFLPHLQSR
jgi:hypothetical protein